MKIKGIAILCLLLSLACLGSVAAQSAKAPLKVWVYDQGRIEVLTKIGKDFEKKYKIPVEISMVDLGQLRTQFLLASGGADCADIGIIPHDNLGALVENGAVLEVKLTAAKKKNYIEPSIGGFTYNGKLYGLPLAVENIGFFRNVDLVPKAPATWDEAVAIAQDLIKQGKATAMMGFPDATYNSFPIYSSFGGAIFGKTNGSYDKDKVEVANEGMVKGLEFMADLTKKGLVSTTIDWDGAHVLFESGKAPFCMTGPWALNRFKTAGVKYEISAFPAAKKGGEAGAPFLGVQGMIVSSASKQAALAQAFLTEFIATEATMKAIYAAEQRPSAWASIFKSAKEKDAAGFNAAGVKAIPMPSIPAMGYVWDAWVNAAALAFSGEKSPKDALLNAKSQVETQIKTNK